MTETDQRIEIAMECGAEWWSYYFIKPDFMELAFEKPRNSAGKCIGTTTIPKRNRWDFGEDVPDYPQDLNAAEQFAKHLATKGWRWSFVLTGGEWSAYVVADGNSIGFKAASTSLAAAICESGLRALSKWRE